MADTDDKLLGDLAVEMGLVRPEQLAECVEAQRVMASVGVVQSIGEILVAKGHLTRDALKELLREERKRSGRLVRIGPYEVVAKLGEGGMGAVYKARVPETGAVLALKVLPKRLSADRDFVARFHREAEIASRLNHPNIVRAMMSGEAGGYHYFAMEFVEGESLGGRLKREGRLAELDALRITRCVALALQHARAAGLVHRDVKPDNIFLAKDGAVKLGDMGLAKETAQDATRITQSGMVVGTPHYVSPEQATGASDIDIRSDIYSLGATLYHMVTGRTPFEGSTAMAILQKHLTEELPWPADINESLTDEICLLIQRMMAKDRSDRYQEPLELIADIDRVMRGESPASQAVPFGRSSIRRAVRARQAAETLEVRRRRAEADARQTPRRAASVAAVAPGRRAGTNWAVVGGGIAAGAVMLVAAIVILVSPSGERRAPAAPRAKPEPGRIETPRPSPPAAGQRPPVTETPQTTPRTPPATPAASPTAPVPPAPVPAPTGDVLYQENWDDGNLRDWRGGELVDVPGRGKVLRAKYTPGDAGGVTIHVSSTWQPHIRLAPGAYFSFSYYLEKPAPSLYVHMKLGAEGDRALQIDLTGEYAPVTGRWATFSIQLEKMTMSGVTPKVVEGDMGRQLAFLATEKYENFLMIDDVRVTRGAPAVPAASPPAASPPAATPPATAPVVRPGAVSFGGAQTRDLGGGKVEMVWEFEKPLDPNAWYLWNVLPDDSGGGFVRMDFPGGDTYQRAMTPRIAFDGDFEVEAVFSGLDGIYRDPASGAESRRPPAPTLGISLLRPDAKGVFPGARVGYYLGGGYERYERGRIEARGYPWPRGWEGLKRHVLRLVRRGDEVEHFCNSEDAGRAEKSLGRERLPQGPVAVDVMLQHSYNVWYTARLESARIVGTPAGELVLPDPALAVPRKASASEQFAYVLAIEKEKGSGSIECLAAYRAWAVCFPGSMRATGWTGWVETAGPLNFLRRKGAPGMVIELWEKVKGDFTEADAVRFFCHLQVGEACAALGRKDEALSHLRLGRDVHECYGNAIGRTLFNFGKYDNAILEWEHCAEKFAGKDEAAQARFAIGGAWLKKGEREKAIAAYRDFLEKCPGHYRSDQAKKAIADIEAEIRSKR